MSAVVLLAACSSTPSGRAPAPSTAAPSTAGDVAGPATPTASPLVLLVLGLGPGRPEKDVDGRSCTHDGRLVSASITLVEHKGLAGANIHPRLQPLEPTGRHEVAQTFQSGSVAVVTVVVSDTSRADITAAASGIHASLGFATAYGIAGRIEPRLPWRGQLGWARPRFQ